MHFHIITLFPEAFSSYASVSIMKRAIEDKKIFLHFYNPRDFTKDKHKRVDRKPYGGGPGMVLEPLSVLSAVKKAVGKKKNVRIIFFTPSGKKFNTEYAESLMKTKHIVFLCGRYEGIDERVKEALSAEGLSIGDYILTGGELPALIIMDSVMRRIKGVLGDDSSVEERRIAGEKVYTRPESFLYKKKTYSVPCVLLKGNHKEIDEFRKKEK